MPANAAQLDWTRPVRMTEAEYLAFEDTALEKHEFYDGIVRPLGLLITMSGGALEHGVIIANAHRFLGNRLDGSPCRTVDSSVRVKAKSSARYFYPDVTIYCGKAETDAADRQRTTLLNPTALVEVLSPGTEKFDRTDKFDHVIRIASLREYVLVEQTEAYVQTLYRDDADQWVLRSWRGGEDAGVTFRSLGIELPFSELYRDVAFSDPADDEKYLIRRDLPSE